MAMEVIEPSGDFTERLRRRLRDEAQYLHIRGSFFVVLSIAIAAACLTPYAIWSLVQMGERSGFFAFVSLWWSDTAVMIDQWQDAGFSLLESLPVFELMFACLMLAVILASAQMIHDAFPIVWKHIQRLRRVNR